MQQIICRYAKRGLAQYVSHLDTMRALERALRRAGLPLVYSQGHNPRLRLSFAAALPVGVTSEAELMALHLEAPVDPDEVRDRVNGQLPEGFEILAAWTPPAYRKRQTFGSVDTADYRVRVEGPVDPEAAAAGIVTLLEADELLAQRGGDRGERTVDIRPCLLALGIEEAGDEHLELQMTLRTGSKGGAKPQEILTGLRLDSRAYRVAIHRTALYAQSQSAPTTIHVARRPGPSRPRRRP